MPVGHVTFRQLEVFVAIAEEGTFTAAAHRLAISQAAISRQVRALEEKLGCDLFVRVQGRSCGLTERGQRLLQESPSLLNTISAVTSRPQRSPTSPKRVRVACGDIIHSMLQPHMAEYCKAHPDIRVEMLEMPPDTVSVKRMSRLHIDLAYFTFSQHASVDGGELIRTLDHGLYLSPQHALAGKWQANAEQSLPLLMYLSGSAAERNICNGLRQAGIANFHIVARAQRTDALLQWAVDGMGACWATTLQVAEHIKRGQLIDLDLGLPKLCRYRFRGSASRSELHVETLDRFLTPLLG
jgi:DNA-binding transcriptional LysR family regulator